VRAGVDGLVASYRSFRTRRAPVTASRASSSSSTMRRGNLRVFTGQIVRGVLALNNQRRFVFGNLPKDTNDGTPRPFVGTPEGSRVRGVESVQARWKPGTCSS
jgi:hypothetical protein